MKPTYEELENKLKNLEIELENLKNSKVAESLQKEKLLAQYTERIKELKGISATSSILNEHRSIEEAFHLISKILPEAWQYPEDTVIRIIYDNKEYKSKKFKVTQWCQKQEFKTINNKTGVIEVYYLKSFPKLDEGPFLKEERSLLNNLANILAVSTTKQLFDNLWRDNKERLKELTLINKISQVTFDLPIAESLHEICKLIPASYQYPRYTVARIKFEGETYLSPKFKETEWTQKETFVTIDNKKGSIEVFYLKEFPLMYEGPFLKEERNLLINISKLMMGYINGIKGRELFHQRTMKAPDNSKPVEYRKSLVTNKQPLNLFFNKQIIDKYVYLDMMKFQVKEILFVATLYDAFILEIEDGFFEKFMGEIFQYTLFRLPRITAVTSSEEAMELLDTVMFDFAVVMVGIDEKAPVTLCSEIKSKKPQLPVFLLLNQKSNLKHFDEIASESNIIDKLFVWNGDSQILFAIFKSLEDMANVENDTHMGLVRVILLIEDSPKYYSKYLPMLYSIVFGQVVQVLAEIERNELYKMSKIRSRPKILLARNYEEAIFIFNKYKDNMLCIISDMEFNREGVLNKTAGVSFINYAKSQLYNLPIVLQSADSENIKIAEKLGVAFINKYSESLLNDLKKFLVYHLAFGDFVFNDAKGNPIAVAKSLREFVALLHTVPDSTLVHHAKNNQFSMWLMARGEVQLARYLNPFRINDNLTVVQMREFLINSINTFTEEKKKGKVLSFEEATEIDERNIVSLSSGSYGGKGRGLAFINTLIYNLDFLAYTGEINFRTPRTAIIGTDEFEMFIERNNLIDILFDKITPYKVIREKFADGKLSQPLIKKLEIILEQITTPLAIRSSSLSEDSITQPFAGVFDTYIIPNNHTNKEVRLNMLIMAIKLVYASVYSDSVRNYFKSIHRKLEEERMAIVIQELVGQRYGDYYYPHISGVAGSYNYYPVSHMKPEEGYAVAAIGLGTYVVGGSKAYRFSPKYPKIEMFTTVDLLQSTQVDFYAVDMCKTEIDLIKDGEHAALCRMDISEAEKHGTIKHCTAVYNVANDRIEDGLSAKGARIINFANILKYNFIPLASTIDMMLRTASEALGSPVEIEYAVDLTKTLNKLPSFYLLQIKPLVSNLVVDEYQFDNLDESKIILLTDSCVGNGKVDSISDIIFVDPHKFDKLRTMEMVNEMEELNNAMIKANRKYVLIGPGRWGTRDQFLGIPVSWSQISNAKVIVEISLPNFPLDSSLGSHFFHNVTSMNVGYFSVKEKSPTDFIKWELIEKQRLVQRTNFFKHIAFEKSFTILMNGKTRKSAILTEI